MKTLSPYHQAPHPPHAVTGPCVGVTGVATRLPASVSSKPRPAAVVVGVVDVVGQRRSLAERVPEGHRAPVEDIGEML